MKEERERERERWLEMPTLLFFLSLWDKKVVEKVTSIPHRAQKKWPTAMTRGRNARCICLVSPEEAEEGYTQRVQPHSFPNPSIESWRNSEKNLLCCFNLSGSDFTHAFVCVCGYVGRRRIPKNLSCHFDSNRNDELKSCMLDLTRPAVCIKSQVDNTNVGFSCQSVSIVNCMLIHHQIW